PGRSLSSESLPHRNSESDRHLPPERPSRSPHAPWHSSNCARRMHLPERASVPTSESPSERPMSHEWAAWTRSPPTARTGDYPADRYAAHAQCATADLFYPDSHGRSFHRDSAPRDSPDPRSRGYTTDIRCLSPREPSPQYPSNPRHSIHST